MAWATLSRKNGESQAIHLDQNDVVDIQQFWTEVETDIHAGGALSFSDDQ